MLRKIHISNYALIDVLDITFDTGFSSVTGETGAGKSIILGALSLILGKRCDTSVLKNKDIKSVVEVEIVLPDNSLKDLFAIHEADFDLHTIIRREITPQGKSRAFINDTPVSLQALKEIGEYLIDIHSQHQNLFLRESTFQCQVVDAAAGNKELLQEYATQYNLLQHKKREFEDFKKAVEKNASDISYLSFRLQELVQAKLQSNELEELEQEASVLEHSEEIKLLFLQAQSVFDSEQNILSQLKSLIQNFEKKKHISVDFEDFYSRLSQTYIELSDIALEINQYNSHLDFDPNRLETIHQRLDVLHGLIHKYKVSTIAELIEEQSKLQQIIQSIENSDIDGAEYKKAYEEQQKQVWIIAEKIRKNRKIAIQNIEPQVIQMLQKLGMPSVSFQIQIKELHELQINGADEISMLFSANKNIPMQWMGTISSGGELSRVMLCLKAILCKSKSLHTIIFDEIDTGVSGEIADQMAHIMESMSADLQVISITHLPQIAAKAKNQFKVYKFESSDTTSTNILQLNTEQRIEELAKMMSGKQINEAAILNAKHLLGIN